MPGLVVDTWETFEQRDGERNDQRARTYTRTFIVETNSRKTEQAVVLLAPKLPRVWNPYFGPDGFVDSFSWCRSVQARQDTQNPYLWRVVCRYDSKLERPDLNQIENPLLRPAEIEWDTVVEPRVAWKDRDGKAILNSANDYFDPPITRDARTSQLTIIKNQVEYNHLFYEKYRDSVNKDAWYGLQPGRWRCCSIKGRRQFEAGIYFWVTTYVFQIRQRDGESETDLSDKAKSKLAWAKQVLDAGFNVYSSEAPNKKKPYLVNGRPISSPGLLDGQGSALDPSEKDPVYLDFHIYPERTFAELYLL